MLGHRSSIVVGIACVLCACNQPSAPDSSSTGSAASGVHADASAPHSGLDISAARNAAQVKRFEDEAALPRSDVVVRTQVTARAAPLGDQVAAIVPNGAHVAEVAAEGDWHLVLFNDPQDPAAGTKLAGWIYKDATAAQAAEARDLPPFSCETGEVELLADRRCRRACDQDSECIAVAGLCDGFGEVENQSQVTSEQRYCIAAPR
jgi:hypothetical protein